MRRFTVSLILGLGLTACSDEHAAQHCREDIRALWPVPKTQITIGSRQHTAEVISDPADLERGWRFRTCHLELLVLDLVELNDEGSEREPVAIDTCGLTVSIDVAFVSAGVIDSVVEAAEPCQNPSCRDCPTYSSQTPVEAILEAPTGSGLFEPGLEFHRVPIDGN